MLTILFFIEPDDGLILIVDTNYYYTNNIFLLFVIEPGDGDLILMVDHN